MINDALFLTLTWNNENTKVQFAMHTKVKIYICMIAHTKSVLGEFKLIIIIKNKKLVTQVGTHEHIVIIV